MKKHVSFIGIALLGSAAIQASSIARPQQQMTAKPPELPFILYPNGQKMDEASFLIGMYYIGGAAGQTHCRVATQGIPAVPTGNVPTQGGLVSAPKDWTNGFRIDFSGSSGGPNSHSISLSYSFMTSNNHAKTVSKPNSEADMLPTFATSVPTGATSVQRKVTAHYKLPAFHNAAAMYSRSLYANPVFSLMAVTGIHIFALNHKLDTNYTAEVSGADATHFFHMGESTYGAGPLVGFTATKQLTNSWALRGNLFGSAPLASHQLTQNNKYQSSPAGDTTYGINTQGNHTCTSFVGHVDLETVFRSEFDNGTSIELVAGWHIKQFVNTTFLTSFSNTQGNPAGSVELNAVKVGAIFIF